MYVHRLEGYLSALADNSSDPSSCHVFQGQQGAIFSLGMTSVDLS